MRGRVLERKILVVEDQEVLADLYASVLRRQGWAVWVARSAEEGLGIFSVERPPVVLSDYHLPEMDGISLLGKLRVSAPETCVILLSGYLTSELLNSALENGAFLCLKKPASLHKLFSSIEDAYARACMLADGDAVLTPADLMRPLESRLEAASSCAVIIDRGYRIVSGNAAFLARFSQDSIGLRCYEVLSVSGRLCPGCRAVAAFDLGQGHVLERAVPLVQDELAAVYEHIEPSPSVDGKQFALLSFVPKLKLPVSAPAERSGNGGNGGAAKNAATGPAVAIASCEGRLLSANTAFEQFFGPLREGKNAKTFLDLGDRWFLSLLEKRGGSFQTLAEQGEPVEFRARLAGGAPLPMLWHFSPFSLDDGGTPLIVCVGHPVAEEQSLGRLVEFYNASTERLLSGQFDMTVVCDDDLKIVSANGPSLRALRMKRKDLQGRPLSSILQGEEGLRSLQQALTAHDAAVRENLRFALCGANGVTIPVCANALAVHDVYNLTRGLAIVMRDMHHQEEFERALSQTERTHILGELSAGIVHQLHNYIHSLTGWAELLTAEAHDTEIARHILESAAGMKKLVGEVLQLASQQGNRAVQDICLGDAFDRLARLTRWRMERDGIALTFEGETERSLRTLPTSLEQALLCLVMNAADAVIEAKRTSGERWIRVKSRFLPDVVWIDICDNGRGVPASLQPEIFRSFYSTKAAGTGLGLSLSRSLLQVIGGEVSLAESSARGSVFRIALPLSCAEGTGA